MELRQLEHFVTVAEERHFTHAADLLQISQSGLSASIRSLESELGTPLFLRSTRRVELTAAGHALLVESVRTLASASAARDAVAAVRGLVKGTLTVGAEPCLGVFDLPTELAAFRKTHPGVAIRLRLAGSTELVESVSDGRIDVALVVDTGHESARVTMRDLATQHMLVLCHPGHPFAARDHIDLTDLRSESLVGFPAGWGAEVVTRRAFAAAGFDYRPTLEVGDVHPLLDLVEHDLGVAVVPADFAKKRPDRLAAVRIGAGCPDWTVAVAARDEPSPAATTFLHQLIGVRGDPGQAGVAASPHQA